MSILQQFEVIDVSVPAEITVGRDRLDVFTPVHLNIGNTRFNESPRQQAALTKRRMTIGFARCLGFLRQVEGGSRLWTGDQTIGSLISPVPRSKSRIIQSFQGTIQISSNTVTIMNPVGVQTVQQVERRDFDMAFIRTTNHKRIGRFSKFAAAVSFNLPHNILGNSSTDHDKWRKGILMTAMLANDGAKVWLDRFWTFLKPGQANGSSIGMAGLSRHV